VVVEDEAELAVAIAARLRSDGHNVGVAEDGPGAVRLVGSRRPDLVVLDLMLPGFDGLEVCRQIQRDRPVPVIMLTARGSETDLLVGLAVGGRRLPQQAVQHARTDRAGPGAAAPGGTVLG